VADGEGGHRQVGGGGGERWIRRHRGAILWTQPSTIVIVRLRPVHGILVVTFFIAAVLVADWAIELRSGRSKAARVMPKNGVVELDLARLAAGQARFYQFINPANQEVRFFVARDRSGKLQVAFDAAENDYKRKLGFRQEGDWLVNNKCDTALRLEEVNAGTSGCRPAPLKHRLMGQKLVLQEADVLTGWRYFN
jgi:uncharacterized membrane protein